MRKKIIVDVLFTLSISFALASMYFHLTYSDSTKVTFTTVSPDAVTITGKVSTDNMIGVLDALTKEDTVAFIYLYSEYDTIEVFWSSISNRKIPDQLLRNDTPKFVSKQYIRRKLSGE